MNNEYNNMAGRLIVALDYPDATQASQLIDQLQGIPCYMKVGMQLFYAAGPDFVRELKSKGYSVFLDLKMHDIPNTVRGGAESITRLGVDMFNVHAAGGTHMMQAAYEGMTNALAGDTSLKKPLIIAVTQLTSTSQSVLNEQIGVAGNIQDAVVRYAQLSASAGLHGVVASAQEVPSIGEACGSDFITVTPGIRPAGSHIGDQSRVLTPGEAIRQGSHYIVVGRPITGATNPREATEQIIEEMIQS
ncbi:orotidine-5'-phosphate decarboxylase [Paenibacillus sp. IHBB 10380]|uniref:orotidine-5'-phosphate decarboxylase n=1 Tax=Paenibacillus sp. IHBB 10380 TaxID=1566358 RepID=UPI0005CFC403|nr:orotidine-5'-phosphate decarboxylase [Paenibacillus sp. IHBB 10380]AJS57775.1 orotidine 5'-phosphate decarboxylase [Paenibacillus sp. IHBB 10380]